jgi:hypothetical protein
MPVKSKIEPNSQRINVLPCVEAKYTYSTILPIKCVAITFYLELRFGIA